MVFERLRLEFTSEQRLESGKSLAGLSDFVKGIPPNFGPIVFWNTFNSRDLSEQAAGVDYGDLLPSSHGFLL